ncbi:MAG: hypothetical protein HUJ56_12790, partial [Erysipelotrichaceae bacterium]|nr:hypothetical protein [Erysipelotrichaceae bacterium]
MDFSNYLSKLINKIGSVRFLALTFVVVMFTGSFLLCLPCANIHAGVPYIDHLFTAVSATCVTGLLTVAIGETYTLFGQIVILVLIQIGGLSLMSFVALFLMMMGKRITLTEKKIISDALNKSSMSSVASFMKRVLAYTALFEGIGFILFLFIFVPEFGLFKGLFTSLFTSVSAFCNAGMDTLGSTSLEKYLTHPLMNFTVCFLIITGSLGFAVWFDLKDALDKVIQKKKSFKRILRELTLHSKLVLVSTGFLLLSMTLYVVLNEWNNPLTLGNLSFGNKLMASFFQSTTLRTAGFVTIPQANFKLATAFLMCFWMIIGGSPGGTAGGIKTTTVVIIFLTIYSYLRHGEHVDPKAFKRSIPVSTFMKAMSIIGLYIGILTIALIGLMMSEDAEMIALFYEAFSAIGTVGLSMGLT